MNVPGAKDFSNSTNNIVTITRTHAPIAEFLVKRARLPRKMGTHVHATMLWLAALRQV